MSQWFAIWEITLGFHRVSQNCNEADVVLKPHCNSITSVCLKKWMPKHLSKDYWYRGLRMQLRTAEPCGSRKAEMPADQLSVNRWPRSISQNNTGNKAFQVKQNQGGTPCKAPRNHLHYCLGGSTAILAGWTRCTMWHYCTVSYVKQFHKAFIAKGRGSCSSPGNTGQHLSYHLTLAPPPFNFT